MIPFDSAPYVLWVLVLALLGRHVARRLRLPTEGLEGFAFAYGLGTGVGSLILFALVSVRALGLPSGTAGRAGGPGSAGPGIWDAVLWLGFLLAVVEGVRLSRARAAARRSATASAPAVLPPPRPPLPPIRLRRLELLPLGIGIALLLAALAPETGIDALGAHLPAAARFVRDGIRPMAGVLGGEGRLGFSILAVPRLDGAWPVGPALLHAAAGLALVAAVHAEIARRAGRRLAAVSAALLLATPAIAFPSTTLGVELGLGLHAVLALLCAARAARGEPGAHVLAAGLLSGFAANDDLAGLLVVLSTGLALHVGLGARRGMRPALAAAGVALTLTVPWFLRAWRDTGNPLFPYAVERLGSGWADPTIVQATTLGPFRDAGALLGLSERVGAPLRAAFARGEGAALPLALLLVAAVAFLLRRPRGGPRDGRPLVVGGVALGVLGLAGFPAARLLVPVLALATIAAATGLARIAAHPGRSRAPALLLGAILVVAGAWDAAATARAIGPRLAALRSTTAAAALVDEAHPGIRAGAAFAAMLPGPILFASEATAGVRADAVSLTPERNGLLPMARLASSSNAYLREEMRRRGWVAFVFRPARPEDAALAEKAVDLFRKRLGTLRASADGTWQAFVPNGRR